MNEKKIKFNIIDALVILVVVVALVFGGLKIFLPKGDKANDTSNDKKPKKTVSYIVTYYCEEVPEYAANAIEVGTPLTDDTTTLDLGEVTNFKLSPSTSYATDAEGVIHLSPKPLYHTVEIESIVEIPEEDVDFEFGIDVNDAYLGVGHTLTFRAGKAKLYGRVSGIRLAE